MEDNGHQSTHTTLQSLRKTTELLEAIPENGVLTVDVVARLKELCGEDIMMRVWARAMVKATKRKFNRKG
jgi:hypothetical protein